MNRLTKDLKTPHDDTAYSDVIVNTVDREDIVLSKLKHYEDLEDELGCPLDVVFRALKEGISYNREDVARTYNVKEWLDFATRPRLYYSNDFECWCFELFLGGYVLQLEDYGKTWWLKGDRSE